MNNIKTMNIYEKLQNARIGMQNSFISKSGNNAFAKFDYFELKDFLPKINELFLEYRLVSIFDAGDNDIISLTIINYDKTDEKVVFRMRRKEVPMNNAMQAEGAINTYARRYLYMNALEICENDKIDSTNGETNKKETDSQATEKQKKLIADYIMRIMKSNNNDIIEQVSELMKKNGFSSNKDVKKLNYSKKVANVIITELKNYMENINV